MAGRLQLIEQKLMAIDSSEFQCLCDAYLILRESNNSSLNRTGSQLGKKKTIYGTPDSFIRLSDNKLAYAEHTTQVKSKIGKIKDDIDKCLDETKTGVHPKRIHKIIICFNSRLTTKEESEIQKYAESKNKHIELIGIDTLAIDIFFKYPLLSREFLGLSIETGQILPFDKFISEYNNKASQLSTPLDNKFLHRKNELNEILNNLKFGDLIFLSGAAGTGKTKIGIEAINKFTKENPTYKSYAIAQKNVDIFEDLRIQLIDNKNYILLVDDANRQLSNLAQILGLFKEERKGSLKIIITVRNYALDDICKLTNKLKYNVVRITKFTDKEIIDIIESSSFRIFNSQYQRRIVDISDGNVRLAIMAARLANEKQIEFLWEDASDLFDAYFNNFISEFDLFEDSITLKVLGIISFFFTINRKDKEFIESMLNLFNLDYYKFNEAVEELNKRELVEIQYDHIRISEQVMATYFFYKVFIKDSILSFELLLFNYFESWKFRFKDAVISANNSFGYENITSKIQDSISEYLKLISNKNDDVLNFLDLFWFYKQEETLAYFHKKISQLPEPVAPIYLTEYKSNTFISKKEQTLDFISRFFNHLTDNFKASISLGFEYVRKKPEYLPQFIERVRENLIFDEPDELINFKRQVDFIDILIEGVHNKKPHFISAFFPIAKSFLAHSFRVTHGGRHRRITFYNYPLPFCDTIKKLRTKIWKNLFNSFETYPTEVFNIVKDFRPVNYELVPQIIDYDLGLLIPFISKRLSPSVFKYTHFVNEMIYWNDMNQKITNRTYRDLKQTFLTDEYIDSCKLSWNKLRYKNEFDYDFEIEEFQEFKTEELKSTFLFTKDSEFEKLFTAIRNLQLIQEDRFFTASFSVDIVVKENFTKNNKLGFNLLKAILNNYPTGLHMLYNTVSEIIRSSENWTLKLWLVLEKWDNENSISWKINFFNYLPNSSIDNFYCKKLYETITHIESDVSLFVESFSRFNLLDKHIIKRILETIVSKIDKSNISITFSPDFFEKNLDFFEKDYELIKKAYVQQHNINHAGVFDYKSRGFKQIFKKHPYFLKDFMAEHYDKYSSRDKKLNTKLNFLWDSTLNFDIIEETIDLLIVTSPYVGIWNNSVDLFFKELDERQIINVKIFTKKYVLKNKNNQKKINIIFSALKFLPNDVFEELFLHFLSINSSVDFFKEIDWVGNVGVQIGDVNFGELYAKKWEKLLDMASKLNNPLAIIPIKAYLKTKITEEYKVAEHERERKFLRPNW